MQTLDIHRPEMPDLEFVLLVTSLTTIPVQGFGRAIGSFANRRDDILAAIDYLFFVV